jgi:undecaprenyl diphosphate synthase
VRLTAIGDIDNLPKKCNNELASAIEQTKSNTGLNLILALNYSGKWDVLQAIKKLVKDISTSLIDVESIAYNTIDNYLSTANIPDPELLIRTSGEYRISNFMLWQLAYTEIYITDVLWPDFRKQHLNEAIENYSTRERRFGKVINE